MAEPTPSSAPLTTAGEPFIALGECMADQICQRVAELPDRDSPADWPEAMLVTSDELRNIVLDAINDASKAVAAQAPAAVAVRETREELANRLDSERDYLEAIKLPPHNPTLAIEDILNEYEGDDREEVWESIKAYAEGQARGAVLIERDALAATPALPATEDSSAGDLVEVQPAGDWKQIVSNTIGFDFERDKFQTVNADDLRRLAAALQAAALDAIMPPVTPEEFDRDIAELTGSAPQAKAEVQAEPVTGDVLPPIGSKVYIRHGRDDDAHACIVTGYYAWIDLGGSKSLHRVFVRMVYEGTTTENARMLCDCYPTAEAALAKKPPAPQAQPADALDAPWGDLKVAFDCKDSDPLWEAHEKNTLSLPKGWKLTETDGSGARVVAIFRVDHAPRIADGIAVRAAIDAAMAAAQEGGQ